MSSLTDWLQYRQLAGCRYDLIHMVDPLNKAHRPICLESLHMRLHESTGTGHLHMSSTLTGCVCICL